MRLILGSASPRRLELLGQAGITPDDVRPPDIDEAPMPGELPMAYCRRMARQKALAVEADADCVVLCADTTVALGRRILGKPSGAEEAERFLRLLSGRRHRVITAVAVRRGDMLRERDAEAVVRMKRLSSAEIASYLSSDDWKGKAGGYAVQGPAGALIPWMRGSYTAIVGLPLAETVGLLRAAGYPAGGGAA